MAIEDSAIRAGPTFCRLFVLALTITIICPQTFFTIVLDVIGCGYNFVRLSDFKASAINGKTSAGATLPFYSGPVQLKADGPMELIGPSSIALHGGMGGTYVKSVNQSGKGTLTITADGIEPVEITFDISAKKA